MLCRHSGQNAERLAHGRWRDASRRPWDRGDGMTLSAAALAEAVLSALQRAGPVRRRVDRGTRCRGLRRARPCPAGAWPNSWRRPREPPAPTGPSASRRGAARCRRVDARVPLRAAAEAFGTMGAQAFAERGPPRTPRDRREGPSPGRKREESWPAHPSRSPDRVLGSWWPDQPGDRGAAVREFANGRVPPAQGLRETGDHLAPPVRESDR